MTKEQEQVKEFMKVYGQEIPDKVGIPSLEVRRLRAKLILEEALETIDALGFYVKIPHLTAPINSWPSIVMKEHDYGCHNLTSIADGLADLHYVAYCGTAVACGLDMEPIFQEVHRSNMTKFWCDGDEKMDEMVANGCTFTEVATHPEIDISLYVCRDKCGKIIKPPSFSPPNLASIIEEQKQKGEKDFSKQEDIMLCPTCERHISLCYCGYLTKNV